MKPVHNRCCACSGHGHSQCYPDLTRRDFLFQASLLTAGGFALAAGGPGLLGAEGQPETARRPLPGKPLRVQPVLTYHLPQRREATSWREWGGLQTQKDVDAELSRIAAELKALSGKADFAVEFLPLKSVQTPEQAGQAAAGAYDVMIQYAAGGSGKILETLTLKDKWNLMFLRHDPGPVYLWYEIAHPRFLRKTVDEYGQPGMDVDDVVVDSQEALLWRLRSCYGLKNTLGKRIVAIGGSAGWGEGGRHAPDISRGLWKMELQDYSYNELAKRIKVARQNSALIKRCELKAGQYLKQSGVSLHTKRHFVNNAFVLREVLNDVMDEHQTDAITINSCMGTIMPMSETTACLPLSLLNDDGFLAFCESDFVVIPSGILLHYISGKPVFLNDPTYPHDQVVTLAHCTAPRKMNGQRYEKAKILTHFESDYGAAPKVEMKLGQICTNLVPDFNSKKWVGFKGTIVGNPFLDICRSQIDVRIHGDGAALLREMKGFHWMMSYGDYLLETGYALHKVGLDWHDVSAPKPA
jgi:hypothetical protein